MKYAPVLIPTLNRYEHFKRCLESLEKCTGADKTEVYIGLDYPPSEKYIDGWRKIDQYLKYKEENSSFGKLIVERRTHNYGICKENGNLETMIRDISDRYDRYIVSEDDNEFSPCFLDFMSKALEKYKDNPKVYSVCGYTQPKYQVKGKDVIFIYDNSAWGFGRWLNREVPDMKYVVTELHSIKSVVKLWIRYPALLNEILSMVNKKARYGDAMYSMQCVCEETYQVRPAISLVRNTGDDGSGQHTGISGKFSKQEISAESNFSLVTDEVCRTIEADRAVRTNMMPENIVQRLKVHLSIFRKVVSFYFRQS